MFPNRVNPSVSNIAPFKILNSLLAALIGNYFSVVILSKNKLGIVKLMKGTYKLSVKYVIINFVLKVSVKTYCTLP